MEKDERQSGGPEQAASNREPRQPSPPAPGKVTRTSKLPSSRGPAVQRKAAAPGSGAGGPQTRSAWDHTMDTWMDAAHRGVTALAGKSAEALLNSSGPAASANQVQKLESTGPSPGAGSSQPEVTPSDALSLARKGRLGKLPHKAELEQRFQRNLDNLHAYFGAPARDACAMVQAEAFCVGNVLVFSTESPDLDMVAHEVAHALQQGGDQQPLTSTPANLAIDAANSVAEQEAVHQARTGGEAVQPSPEKDAPDILLARLPAPADCHTRRPGLSPIQPIIKETYDGSASTTIQNGWELGSAERRWQIYDATDHLVYESFYTWPQPTLTIPKELITGGIAGGKDRPWSVWLKATRTLVPFGDDDPTNFPHDYTTFEVYETQAERREAGPEIDGDEEWDVRIPGLSPPQRSGVLAPGGTQVSPQVAIEILGNLSRGAPPFKPEMGKAGCSWFVSEGNPFVGIDPAKNVSLPVEIARPNEPVIFDEAKLDTLHERIKTQFESQAEAQYRQLKGIPAEQALNSRQRKGLARFIERATESRMWDEVGKQVRESSQKVGEVILRGSKYSRSGDGKFLVVADAARIQVKGGLPAVVSALEGAGTPVEPVVQEAAEEMAKRLKWAGRVRAVFRYGGRILIVVALAQDVYTVYTAQNRTKAVFTSVGGWVGASAAAAAFAAWWTPADVAGPWAWAGHGVGTLVSGGIGYWIGSQTMRTIYELVLE
jgi:hypothetical protein